MRQIQAIIALALVRNAQGELLIAKRKDKDTAGADGKWELPGGKIEFGEAPESAAIREVKEETGLDVEIVRLIPQSLFNIWQGSDNERQVFYFAYECVVNGGALHDKEFDPKISELKFIDPADIGNYDTLPKVPELIGLLTTNN